MTSNNTNRPSPMEPDPLGEAGKGKKDIKTQNLIPSKEEKEKKRGKKVRKNPGGVKELVKSGVLDGFDAAKLDMQDVVSDAVRGLFGTVVKAGMAKGVAGMGKWAVNGVEGQQKQGYQTDWPGWFLPLITGEYGVILISGTRDSGKTTVAVNIAESRQKALGTNIYFLNYPEDLAPENITPVHGDRLPELMEMAEFGSTIVVDDASLLVNSKRNMTGQGLAFESLINTIAHRGVLLIITVQDTSDLNKAGLRADAYVLKPPERMFLQTERPRMRIIQEMALAQFDEIPRDDWIKHVFVFMDNERKGLVEYSRPEWMTREHAKYRRKIGGGGLPDARVSTQKGITQGQGEMVEGQFKAVSSGAPNENGPFDYGDSESLI